MKNVFLTAILLGLFGLVFFGCEMSLTNSPEDLEVELRSAVPVPFNATYIMNGSPPQPNPEACGAGPGILYLTREGSGKASHMGKVTAYQTSCADISNGLPPRIFNLHLTLTAANGDELWLEIVEGSSSGQSGQFMIVGGSGRFRNATGIVDARYEPADPPIAGFINYLEGEIQY